MTFQKQLHDILPLIDEPFSVIELAKTECLPPMLHIDNIALLMYPDSKKLQKAFQIMLKTAIRNNDLDVVSVDEFTRLITEHEQSRDSGQYIQPQPPHHLPLIAMTAIGYSSTDLLPGHEGMKHGQCRMFVVHRNEMKKWLAKKNEWPLPEDNLLSRWWPDSPLHKGSSHSEESFSNTGNNYFQLQKDYWQIRFRGETRLIKQSLGMKYITLLIQRAYNDEPEIHVTDLVHLAKGRPATEDTVLNRQTKEQMLEEEGLAVAGLGSGLDLMTPEGKQWAKFQVQQLEEEIEEAEEYGDAGKALKLREKKEAIEDYVRKSFGLSGRARKASDINEKTRKSVSKTIENTLVRMGKKEGDELAVYLDDHLDKGHFCSFRKDPNIFWEIMKK